MPGRADKPLGFPGTARLLRRAEFTRVKEARSTYSDGPLVLSWAPRPVQPTRSGAGVAVARVGLAVSTKVGNAVVRNRVKRRLREAIRHELSNLPAIDLVLSAKPAAAESSVEDFRAILLRAGRRAVKSGGGRSP